jgi:hypothetical protein
MADIRLIKFTSGEEIIGSILDTKEDAYTIKDGVTLVYHQTKEGTVSVGFSPFMPYSTGDIDVLKASIAATSSVKQELLNEYNRIYGSGIVLAGANDAEFKAK